MSAGKFEGKSENRAAFQSWDAKPATACRPKPNNAFDNGDGRNYQTEVSAAFNDKGYQVRRSRAPPAQALVTGKFEGQSEMKASYSVGS